MDLRDRDEAVMVARAPRQQQRRMALSRPPCRSVMRYVSGEPAALCLGHRASKE